MDHRHDLGDVVVGGLGFPVVIDVWERRRRPRGWSLHTKITVLATAFLLITGVIGVLVFEWANGANDRGILSAREDCSPPSSTR